jgi:hypothetical protein
MKRQIMGREVVVAIAKDNSTLDRGSRFSTVNSTASENKRVLIKVIGD